MARHATRNRPAGEEQSGEEQQPSQDAPQMAGGAEGVLAQEGSPGIPQVDPDDPQRKREAVRYMVTDGPRDSSGKIRFYSQGYVVGLPPGKIVTGATHPLKELRDQGITLQRIPDVVDEEPKRDLPPLQPEELTQLPESA
jgi:hypothetical protein